jgi:hypothetical protein
MSSDNRICVIQPPAGDKITDKQIEVMKQHIGQWIDNFVNAPAQPNGQPNPAGTGGAQAPADPLEGLTTMQRAGFTKTMEMIEKICG